MNDDLGLVEVTTGGVRWRVAAEHCERILGPHGLRLDEWLRAGQARPVKKGPHRVVYRVELPGLCCYLKHNLLPDARAWLRQLVRPSKARMEYERALAVAARHVPTIVPLALGERRDGPWPRDSFLITHSLEDAAPLNRFLEADLPALPPMRQARVRQALAVAVGQFMASLHEAGVLHRDLHCGNVLVQLGPDDQPSLYLIDLQAVRLHPPLSWPARRDNLILFNRWFTLRASRPDRLRFWQAYWSRWRAGKGREGEGGEWKSGKGGDSPRAARSLSLAASLPLSPTLSLSPTLYPPPLHHCLLRERARDVEKRTRASNEHFWRHRDRRCRRRNRYFHPVRGPGVVGHAVTDLDAVAFAALTSDPDRPFRRPGVRLLKDSRSSTVAELEMPVSGRPCLVIYKRFRITAWYDPWVNCLRRSPALRSWVFGNSLRERGIPTARPLAVLHRHRGGRLCEGYLLTEKIPNAVDLRAYVTGLDALEAVARRQTLRSHIDALARLIRDLHRRHLCHRDLKATNVLFNKGDGHLFRCAKKMPIPFIGAQTLGPDSATPFWLIDLVGATRHRRAPKRRRLQNLARLNASFWHDHRLTRTDRLRFLRVYLQWGFFGKEGWKGWWRDVEKATRAKVARNARSGRPLG